MIALSWSLLEPDGASVMSGHCTGVQHLLEPEGYEGESVMSGHCTGVQQRVK